MRGLKSSIAVTVLLFILSSCDSSQEQAWYEQASGRFTTGLLRQTVDCAGCIEAQVNQELRVDATFSVDATGNLTGSGSCQYDLAFGFGQSTDRDVRFVGSVLDDEVRLTVTGCLVDSDEWSGSFANGSYSLVAHLLSGVDFRFHSYRDAQNNPIPHQITGDDFRMLVLKR